MKYDHRIGRRPKELDVEQKVVKLFDDQKIMTNVRSSGVPISDSNLEVPESAAAPTITLPRSILSNNMPQSSALVFI